VIVEHPVRLGYELRGDARPVETTAAWNRFRLEVGAKQTSALVVEEARTEQTTYALSNLDADQVALFVKQRSVNPELEAALRRVLAQKDAVSGLESQKSAREEDIEQIFDDQQRLRENMKSLKGSVEEKALLQRYTQQLNAQETRLEELRKEVQQLSQQKEAAQAVLDRTIEELAFDVKL
jgi:predicted  nucleic acid-binding Zn-ribbon protein